MPLLASTCCPNARLYPNANGDTSCDTHHIESCWPGSEQLRQPTPFLCFVDTMLLRIFCLLPFDELSSPSRSQVLRLIVRYRSEWTTSAGLPSTSHKFINFMSSRWMFTAQRTHQSQCPWACTKTDDQLSNIVPCWTVQHQRCTYWSVVLSTAITTERLLLSAPEFGRGSNATMACRVFDPQISVYQQFRLSRA